MTPKQLPSRGFTLIELLVVICIIGILAALMLTPMNKARSAAYQIRCVNNHRQLAIAWGLYVDDFADRLPMNMDSIDNLGSPTNWVAGHMLFAQDRRDRRILTESSKSLLAPYAPAPDLYKCPSDRSSNVRSVSMNCRMAPFRMTGLLPSWVGGYGTNYLVYFRRSSIRSPSEILLILDERSDSINDASFATDLSNTGRPDGIGSVRKFALIDYPGRSHQGRGVFSFSDSHVDQRKWTEPALNVFPGRAKPRIFVDPESSDLNWLQAHSAEPSVPP